MTVELAICEARPLPEASAGAPRTIHLLPLWQFQGRDGRSWSLRDPAGLVARFERSGIDLPIDYEHQADDPARARNGPVPAAGWITSLEVREDGVWGAVRWTDAAAKLIAERAYRFLSPVFKFEPATREVLALTGAGLVHKPNLKLTALAREETPMTPDLSDFATALGLPADADRTEILSAINAQKEAAPDPAKYVPISAVKDLMADRADRIVTATNTEVETMVNDAVERGYITPGMRDWATALCRQDPDSFREFTKASGPVFSYLFKSPLEGRSVPGKTPTASTDAERAICAQLDIQPGKLLPG